VSDDPDGVSDDPDGVFDDPDGVFDDADSVSDDADGVFEDGDGVFEDGDGVSDDPDSTFDDADRVFDRADSVFGGADSVFDETDAASFALRATDGSRRDSGESAAVLAMSGFECSDVLDMGCELWERGQRSLESVVRRYHAGVESDRQRYIQRVVHRLVHRVRERMGIRGKHSTGDGLDRNPVDVSDKPLPLVEGELAPANLFPDSVGGFRKEKVRRKIIVRLGQQTPSRRAMHLWNKPLHYDTGVHH
jgi:hypothetical protein